MNALMASELGVWSVHMCLNVPVHEKLYGRTTECAAVSPPRQ